MSLTQLLSQPALDILWEEGQIDRYIAVENYSDIPGSIKVSILPTVNDMGLSYIFDTNMSAGDYFTTVMRNNPDEFENYNFDIEYDNQNSLPDAVIDQCSWNGDCYENEVCVDFKDYGAKKPYCFRLE